MPPLSVQVITYAPTVFRHCQHCEVAFAGVGLGERIHRAEAQDALPDDLAAEFQQVSDWVHGLLQRHGPRVAVSVIDAASVEGVWKSLRHGVRRYPAVVLDGRERRIGSDFAALDALVDQRIGERSHAGETAPAVERGPPSD
jgi:glutaredoxin